MPGPSIAVIGEALVDLVENGDDDPRLARPGGSPYNVAIGLARLGHHAAFAGRLSTDPLGALLRRHAEASGVDLTLAVSAREPSTVALVQLDEHGVAQYHFGVEGTADFCFTDDELRRLPADLPALHFGSLASWLPPGDARIAARVSALRDSGCAVTYDPNVRPHLQPDAAAARGRLESALALAHLVKTSEEDLSWTYPGRAIPDVAAEWLRLGPSVVVVTCGGEESIAFTAGGSVRRPPVEVEVVDTVGAGDAFMAGLLDALMRRGLLIPSALGGLDADVLPDLLDEAALVAAITCTRAGANPPRRSAVCEWHSETR